MKTLYPTLTALGLGLSVPLLWAGNALADTTCKTADGTVVTISDPTSCSFQVSGGCTANCVPANFSTSCSAKCTVSAESSCTDTCETKCGTECKSSSSFSCTDYCNTDCEAGCMSSCTGSDCSSNCSASCNSECATECMKSTTTDCTTECTNSCTGSCTAQANISCYGSCTTTLTGGCTAQCSTPTGGLFCDGQFIDVTDASDCTFSISGSASGTVSTNCSAAPAPSSPFNVPAGIAAVAGIGLLVSRRRRRS